MNADQVIDRGGLCGVNVASNFPIRGRLLVELSQRQSPSPRIKPCKIERCLPTPSCPETLPTMVKSKEEVVSEFNILTNMSVDELQGWVENPQSKKAGTGVGLESAHKIIGILKKNPSKDPELYDEVSAPVSNVAESILREYCSFRKTLNTCAKSSRKPCFCP